MRYVYPLAWGAGALLAIAPFGLPCGLDRAMAQAETLPLSPAGDLDVLPPVQRPAPTAIADPRASFSEAYVLGPGDRIRIDIFNIPEFSGTENGVHEVLLDGTLALPLAGIVNVQGLSLAEAQTTLTTSYSRLLTRPPQLTVTLLSARPVRVVVAGEVNRPGTYTIDLETSSDGGGGGRQWPSLTQVIQTAGGITQQANVKQVQVRRPQREGDAIISTSLWDLIRGGDISQDVRLRDGDTIVVPQATTISPEESVAISSANFSPEAIPVQVVGEVASPGSVALPANSTLNQAILAAGGFKNSRAQDSTVQLVRLNPNGSVDQRTIPVDLAASANDTSNPILRPNDVVVVNRNTLAATGDTLGVILSPLTALTAIFRLFGF